MVVAVPLMASTGVSCGDGSCGRSTGVSCGDGHGSLWAYYWWQSVVMVMVVVGIVLVPVCSGGSCGHSAGASL